MEAAKRIIMNVIRSLRSPQPASDNDASPLRPSYSPSYADVCVVRAMLKTLNLPTELVLQVLDYAQYWPRRTILSTQVCEASADAPGRIYLDVEILPERILQNSGGEKVKIKAVEFEIWSGDQGWTSENTSGTFIESLFCLRFQFALCTMIYDYGD